MEADWSVEIGPDLPSIDASWPGFVDLRVSTNAIDEIREAAQFPALRNALFLFNSGNSPVFTVKCDAWALDEGEIDPDEFGALRDEACVGFASYVDIVERDPMKFTSFQHHEQRAREVVTHLHALHLGAGRIDLVLRNAFVDGESGFGITLYAAGCGSDPESARKAWEAVLAAAVAATIA
jgi:hypothetical protein